MLLSMRDESMATLYTPRTLAAASVHLAMSRRGVTPPVATAIWLEDVTSRRVDVEDFEELMTKLKDI